MLGFKVEIGVSGGCDVDSGMSVFSVVFSLVTGSLAVVAGTAVGVGIGGGTGALMVVRWETAVVVCSAVLKVGTTEVNVLRVVGGAPVSCVVVVLVVLVGGLRVADVMTAAAGLAVTGLMVGLCVDMGVTRAVVGTLAVVLVAAVVLGDIVLTVDTSRVVTFSRIVVEVVVCCGDHDGGGVVVAFVDTSTLPVTGCAVLVTGSMTTGLIVV